MDANTGCLAPDSLVLKNNDVVPIADLNPGEHVYSLNPQFEIERSLVTAKQTNDPAPVFDLVLQNHRRVRATPNHPFLVARKVGRTRRLGWLPLASIVDGDEVAVVGHSPDLGEPRTFERLLPRSGSRNSFRWPTHSSDDLMWLLGFFLGDGYTERGVRVYFAVPEADPAAERVVGLAKTLFDADLKRVGPVVLRANSANWVDWLHANEFSGNAHTKRIAAWVYRLPHAQKRALIDGYIAADGYMREGHRNVSITSANRELLEDVRQLAISAGLNPLKISKWSRVERKPLGKEEKEYTSYFLYFGEGTLDAPVHFVPVATIEYAGEHPTVDIEVEGTANFIANGIFVHNSKLTMKYPSIYLRGENATADIISVAVGGHGQHQDTGAKAIHLAPNTRSRIVSKSVSRDGGRTSYRGQIKVAPGATNAVASVRCDALMLDDQSRSDTYPYIDIQEDDTTLTHEATVGKISADQVFYLMSRGLTENEAQNLIVQGFLEVFTKELPMEYAIEFNRLVKLEMEGSLG
ncbi:MAG: hypothetical protein FJ038_01415 [Chloroflexi bacterium]|nr:hypothetical protein [Chloroflexota bacterium]